MEQLLEAVGSFAGEYGPQAAWIAGGYAAYWAACKAWRGLRAAFSRQDALRDAQEAMGRHLIARLSSPGEPWVVQPGQAEGVRTDAHPPLCLAWGEDGRGERVVVASSDLEWDDLLPRDRKKVFRLAKAKRKALVAAASRGQRLGRLSRLVSICRGGAAPLPVVEAPPSSRSGF